MYALTYYKATPSVTSKRQQEGTRSHQEPPGATRSYREPPGATGRQEEPPGATRSHQEPPGGTRTHPQSLASPVYPCPPTAPYKSDWTQFMAIGEVTFWGSVLTPFLSLGQLLALSWGTLPPSCYNSHAILLYCPYHSVCMISYIFRYQRASSSLTQPQRVAGVSNTTQQKKGERPLAELFREQQGCLSMHDILHTVHDRHVRTVVL